MLDEQQITHTLLAAERQLPQFLDGLPDAMLIMDPSGTMMYANEKAAIKFHKKKHELLGLNLWKHIPELIATPLYKAFYTVLRTQEGAQTEYFSPNLKETVYVNLLPAGEGGVLLYFYERAESALLRSSYTPSKEAYWEIPESMRAGVAFLSPDGKLLDINSLPLKGIQRRLEEVVGMPVAETPWWSGSAEAQQLLRSGIERAARGETVSFDAVTRMYEKRIVLAVTITPHMSSGNHVDYLVCSGIDITARKEAEEEFRVLAESMPQFVWVAQADGTTYEYCNQQFMDYVGITRQQTSEDESMCYYGLNHIHPDDWQNTTLAWEVAARAGGMYETEMRIRSKDTGEYRWFLTRAMPVKDDQGTILKWLGTSTDIHEEKQAEEELHAVIESIPQHVWIADPDGQTHYFNQRWLSYTGMTMEQARNRGWLQAVHPDDRQRILEKWRVAVQESTLYEAELRMRNGSSGEYRWFLTRAVMLKDSQGKMRKWFGTSTDIHEKKQLEVALRASEVRFKALFESNMIGVCVVDMQGRIFEANDAYLQLIGYTQEDVQNGKVVLQDIMEKESYDVRAHVIEELKEKGVSPPAEKIYLHKNGGRVSIVSGAAMIDTLEDTYIGFALDITEKKELEYRKDEFISIVSHELKAPLTVLKLQHALLLRKLTKEGYSEPKEIARMEVQITSLTRLINDLLDVSKIQMGKFSYVDELLDLDIVIREIVDMSQQVINSHTLHLHGELHGEIMADRDRLEQVLSNLLYNAVKYSPQADRVDIFLSQNERAVFIKVQDYGVGISKEHQRAIFERFNRGVYGTREKAFPGLGMGLYIAHEIVKQYGGEITVESEEGKGAAFLLSLPLPSSRILHDVEQ